MSVQDAGGLSAPDAAALGRLVEAAGPSALVVRDPDAPHDSIDGLRPRFVVEPRTPEAVAAVLAWASDQRLSVVIRGQGTKLAWGRRPERLDAVVTLCRMTRVLTHRAGDLIVSVEAGATLAALNTVLGVHGQWLPLDPPFADRATIGGILASNDSGPLRHRFGTPRDLVIGVELATTDGRLAKAGGQVVKNVAGYDLSKLVSGSFGTLAAIVSATFKLSPVAGTSSTIVLDRIDADALARIAIRLEETQLEPAAVELHATRGRTGASTSCLLRFASVAAAVEAQVVQACAVLGAGGTRQVVTGETEHEVWRRHAARIWEAPGAIVRASWLPAAILQAVRGLEQLAAHGEVEMIGRVGIGSGLIAIDGDTARQAAAIAQLRAGGVFGNVVVLRASAELKAATDVWPAVPNAAVLSSVKRALDPHGVLGAGRGPL